MPTLLFPERDALRQLLADGVLPPSVVQAPATVGHDGQNRLVLTTSTSLSKEILALLAERGVSVVGSNSVATQKAVSCWHEAIPLERVAVDNLVGRTVMFDIKGSELAALAGQLDRLGGQSWSCRWRDQPEDETGGDRLLLKTISPPFIAWQRALEADDPETMHAYVEWVPRVWIAAGWTHPLAERIRPPAGRELLLRPPDVWEWRDVRDFAEPGLGERRSVSPTWLLAAYVERTHRRSSLAVNIPLRLLPDPDEATAELWMIDEDALGWLTRFVRGVDAPTLQLFTFAVAKREGRPFVLLHARTSREPPPILIDLPAGYRPLLKLANLFVPCGRRLTPLPRRDVLRGLFAADSLRLSWLRPLEYGAFQPESLPLDSFRPLSAWVEHRNEEAHQVREAWPQTNPFEFAPFIERRGGSFASSSGLHETPAPEPLPERQPQREAPAGPAERPRKRGLLGRLWGSIFSARTEEPEPVAAADEEAPPIPSEEARQIALGLPQERSLKPPEKVDQARSHGKRLESRFLATLARLTPRDRLELWPDLAASYAQANNPTEAAICWLNALWEQEKFSPSWSLGWLRAEAALARWDLGHVRIEDKLAAPASAAQVRAIAAYTVWAARQEPHPAGFLASLGSLQAYFDQHEAHLPVRAAWLARSALVRLTRGDVLALARTRDRLFHILLQHGLSLDTDAPAFIRFAESGDADRFRQVRGWLADRRKSIHDWIEQLGPPPSAMGPDRISLAPFGLEAEVRGTRAYADLMLAWGQARLGEKTEAERLLEQAGPNLDEGDPVHAFLKMAFSWRIQQAREGKLAGGPLPAELLGRLSGLSVDNRYQIDKLRQHSRILDPTERINAYWASTLHRYRNWPQLNRQLVDLPGLDSTALNESVQRLLLRGAGEAAAAMPLILVSVLDEAPRLDRALAEKALQAIPQTLDMVASTSGAQLRLLEKGLLAAAAVDRPTTVQLLAHRFARFVEEQRGLPASTMLEGLTGQTFRCLRRLGMKNEADRVLFQIAGWLTRGEKIADLRRSRGSDWPSLMRTLLHVAAGWFYCGRDEQGYAIIDEVRKDLYGGGLALDERTALALTYAGTLGQVPVRLAFGRFEELFQRLKRISVNGTNSHFTLQPLELIDTVVIATVSEDFTLGPLIRGWLDDEEYLVRQRIHRELKELMEEQGV